MQASCTAASHLMTSRKEQCKTLCTQRLIGKQSSPLDLDQIYRRSREDIKKPWAAPQHISPTKALSALCTKLEDPHLPSPSMEGYSPPTILSQL